MTPPSAPIEPVSSLTLAVDPLETLPPPWVGQHLSMKAWRTAGLDDRMD
jgi:hypothetical protein